MANKSLNELVVLAESLAHGNLSFEDFTKQISAEDDEIKNLVVDYAHSLRLEYNCLQLYKLTNEDWAFEALDRQQVITAEILKTLKTLIK